MPVMDGLDCTKCIRETDKTTPIIAFTANVFATELERCWQVGMNDHLPKPFLKVDVEKIIDKWCRDKPEFTPNSNGKESCD